MYWDALRHAVTTLGSAAAASGKPITVKKQLMAAAKWMEAQDLVKLDAQNQLILLEDTLEIQTSLGRPELVHDSPDRNCQSIWGMRTELHRLGWVHSDKPSVENKTFHSHNPSHSYFVVLLE